MKTLLTSSNGKAAKRGRSGMVCDVDMLDEVKAGADRLIDEKKRAALECLTEAWADAEAEGIESDILAHAALFAAIIDLVGRYGEMAVSDMFKDFPQKILSGDYTVRRTMQ